MSPRGEHQHRGAAGVCPQAVFPLCRGAPAGRMLTLPHRPPPHPVQGGRGEGSGSVIAEPLVQSSAQCPGDRA